MAKSLTQQVNEATTKTSQANRFRISDIARHTHTNINSPAVIQPVLVYIGISSFSFVSGRSFCTLPTGWIMDWQTGGQFLLTHNLNVDLYTCVATASNADTRKVVVTTTQAPKTVTFNWYNLSGTATDTDFVFNLSVPNISKSVFSLTYSGPDVT